VGFLLGSLVPASRLNRWAAQAKVRAQAA